MSFPGPTKGVGSPTFFSPFFISPRISPHGSSPELILSDPEITFNGSLDEEQPRRVSIYSPPQLAPRALKRLREEEDASGEVVLTSSLDTSNATAAGIPLGFPLNPSSLAAALKLLQVTPDDDSVNENERPAKKSKSVMFSDSESESDLETINCNEKIVQLNRSLCNTDFCSVRAGVDDRSGLQPIFAPIIADVLDIQKIMIRGNLNMASKCELKKSVKIFAAALFKKIHEDCIKFYIRQRLSSEESEKIKACALFEEARKDPYTFAVKQLKWMIGCPPKGNTREIRFVNFLTK
jgi:hypothetical protein